MSTRTYNSYANNTSDAEFRAWTKEFSDNLQLAGLTKTTDTGQINHLTVLRPAAANGVAGYEIYRFNDALQATAPVFIKLEYGVAANVGMPMVWVTVGSSTSGTGVLNGVNTTRTQAFFNRYGHTPTQNVNFATNMCVLPGYVMVIFKQNGYVSGGGNHLPACMGFFLIGRTVDQSNGANDGRGVVYYRYYADSNVNLGFVAQTLSFVNARPFPAATYTEQHHVVPFDITNSLVQGTDIQLFRHMSCLPEIGYIPWICTYLSTEITQGTVFPAVLVGSTERDMLSLGNTGNYSGANRDSNHCNAVVFA